MWKTRNGQGSLEEERWKTCVTRFQALMWNGSSQDAVVLTRDGS